jgi:hypothetical protein
MPISEELERSFSNLCLFSPFFSSYSYFLVVLLLFYFLKSFMSLNSWVQAIYSLHVSGTTGIATEPGTNEVLLLKE